jgi:uncharacterized alkaline shock family protein YloU
MTIEIPSTLGRIIVSNEVVSDVVGIATIETAGVVGMASQKKLKDGVSELLKRENYSKGIIIRETEDGLQIDLHIVILFGVKISEIANNVQERVKHSVQDIIGLDTYSVNVFIEDVNYLEK